MAMVIDTNDLESDKAGFERMITAYSFFIGGISAVNYPEKAEDLAELKAGLANTQDDLADTVALIDVIKTYEAHGVPLHNKEIASQAVIDRLKFYLGEAGLVPGDFEPEPEITADSGVVQVG